MERGAVANAREAVVEVLELRFGRVPDSLRDRVHRIEDQATLRGFTGRLLRPSPWRRSAARSTSRLARGEVGRPADSVRPLLGPPRQVSDTRGRKAALLDGEPHGYAIIRDVEARTEGRRVLPPGALYRHLHRMLHPGRTFLVDACVGALCRGWPCP